MTLRLGSVFVTLFGRSIEDEGPVPVTQKSAWRRAYAPRLLRGLTGSVGVGGSIASSTGSTEAGTAGVRLVSWTDKRKRPLAGMTIFVSPVISPTSPPALAGNSPNDV